MEAPVRCWPQYEVNVPNTQICCTTADRFVLNDRGNQAAKRILANTSFDTGARTVYAATDSDSVYASIVVGAVVRVIAVFFVSGKRHLH